MSKDNTTRVANTRALIEETLDCPTLFVGTAEWDPKHAHDLDVIVPSEVMTEAAEALAEELKGRKPAECLDQIACGYYGSRYVYVDCSDPIYITVNLIPLPVNDAAIWDKASTVMKSVYSVTGAERLRLNRDLRHSVYEILRAVIKMVGPGEEG
jgi:hypothetical protein